MTEDQDQPLTGKISEHRIILLIIGSIIIALMLVIIAMAMYRDSPASRIDLSLPGLQSIQPQAEQYDDFKEFSASGSVDKTTLDEFKKLYDKQALPSANFDAFGSDVLSDQVLHIDNPPAPQE